MTKSIRTSKPLRIQRVHSSCPDRLLKALKVLLSDEEIQVLVDHVRGDINPARRTKTARKQVVVRGDEVPL